MTARLFSYAARADARAALRARERAKFVIDTAITHGVHVAIRSHPRTPCIYAWAPTAATPELQLQCERSFKRAVRQNLRAIRRLATEPGGSG